MHQLQQAKIYGSRFMNSAQQQAAAAASSQQPTSQPINHPHPRPPIS